MPRFYFKMPFTKSLSYAFARVSGAAVLCTNIVCRTGHDGGRTDLRRTVGQGMNNRYSFIWYEMRPLPDDATLYSIERCSYTRNSWAGISGARLYNQQRYRRPQLSPRHGVYFSRHEAVAEMKRLEQNLLEKEGYVAVGNMPAAMKALSVHKVPFYGR